MFYLYTLGAPPVVNGLIVAVLCTCVFAPVSFVNPARTPLLRGWTLTASVVWAALLLVLAWSFDDTPSSLAAWSLIFPLYYVGLSFALHARRDPAVR